MDENKFIDANEALNSNAATNKDKEQQQGRKSMGRRVSFAATAKVRLFEKLTAEDDDSDAMSIDDPLPAKPSDDTLDLSGAAISPLKAPGTPTNRLPTILSPTPGSRIPVRSPRRYDTRNGPERNNGGHDDLGSDDSLITTEDPLDKNDGGDEGEDDREMNIDNDTMDFTTCIGGPVSTFQRLSEANTMDFTGCVGRILTDEHYSNSIGGDEANAGNMGHDATVGTTRASKYDELENDTMDLTTCIGGLLGDADQGSPMQLTSVIDYSTYGGRNIADHAVLPGSTRASNRTTPERKVHPAVAALKLTSPSPFLIHSPLTPGSHRRHSDVSLIDEVDRPDFTLLASPVTTAAIASKSLSNRSSQPSLVREEDDLFRHFINPDPSSVNCVASVADNNGRPLVPSGENLFDLKGFLADAGIRFMDNLSSLARRETMGRPNRDSDVLSLAKQRFLTAKAVPERAAVEERCGDIVGKITVLKEDIADLEGRIIHTDPSSIPASQHMLSDPEEAKQRLKTIKSVARLQARQEWYEWRTGVERPLLQTLQENARQIADCHAYLQTREADLDAIGVPLVRMIDTLEAQFAGVRAEEEARASLDWNAIGQMNDELASLLTEQEAFERELRELAAQEEQLRGHLTAAQDTKRSLQAALDSANQQLAELEECSETALKEVKSRVALLSAIHGWQIAAIRPSTLIIDYRGSVQTRFELVNRGPDTLVTAVQLSTANCSKERPFLRLSPSVVKVEADRPLLPVLLSVLTQLDRLFLFDKALHAHPLSCALYTGAESAVDAVGEIARHNNPTTTSVPLLFFSHLKKIRFRCQLAVAVDRIVLNLAEIEYGTVTPAQLAEVVEQANLTANRHLQLSVFLDLIDGVLL